MIDRYTIKDEEHAKMGLVLSDKMIQSDYFRVNDKDLPAIW